MPCTPNRTPARLISKSFSRNVPSNDLAQPRGVRHGRRARQHVGASEGAHSSNGACSSGTSMGAGLGGLTRRRAGAASLTTATGAGEGLQQ